MRRTDKRKSLGTPLNEDPPDDDVATNIQIEKQRRNINFTIRHGLKINQRAKKSMYKTAGRKAMTCSSAPKTRWGEEDESKHEVKAHIRDTDTLTDSSEWDTLVGHGITHLTIEDHANALSEIPADLTSIQTLRSLTFMWSKVKSLPEHLLQMSLKELYLQKCPLKSVDGLHEMTKLTKLELTNGFLKKLPMEIGEMTRLESLVLDGNLLKALPTSIGNLSKLEVLKVCANKLKNLPSTITELGNLLTLDASQNNIRDLPEDIGRLANLVTLRMSHNQLTSLPVSMQQLCSLRNLYLGHNLFIEIPAVLCHMNELITLNMVANNIQSFSTPLPNLTTLLLDKNEITELQTPLFGCVSLQTLSLQFNKITAVPPLIKRLTKLRILYLGGNDITQLPEEICDLSDLRHLVLRESAIKEFPVRFDHLKNLNVLDIDGTNVGTRYMYALRTDGVKGLLQLVASLNRRATMMPPEQHLEDEEECDTDEECDMRNVSSDEEIESQPSTPKIIKRRSDVQSQCGPAERKHIISMWPDTGNVPDILRNPPLNMNGPSRTTSTRKDIKTMMPSEEDLLLQNVNAEEPVATMAVVWSENRNRDSSKGPTHDIEMTERITKSPKGDSDLSEISSDEDEKAQPKKQAVRFLSSSGAVHVPQKTLETFNKAPTSDSEDELSEMSDLDVQEEQKMQVQFSTASTPTVTHTTATTDSMPAQEEGKVNDILRRKDSTQNSAVQDSQSEKRVSGVKPPPAPKPNRLSSRASTGPVEMEQSGSVGGPIEDKRASKPKPPVAVKPDRLSQRLSQNLPPDVARKGEEDDDEYDDDDDDDDALANLKASLLSREPSPVIASKPVFQIPPIQSSLHGIKE